MRQVVIDKRYKILRKLGSGAMGVVYKAKDLKNDTIIALKMLSKKKTSSLTVQRFKREFKLLTELHHPNLCAVYDFGMLQDGRSYFTMEYIDGPNIFEFTKNIVRKNISNGVYPLIVQLCRALEYIHTKGLIHYDVKPDNVLIAKDKEPGARGKKHSAQRPMLYAKLLDFGLAGEHRIKGGVLIRGTFPYIAPEVIKGLAVDHRADLFSLGVLLYEIFMRRRFQIKNKQSFVTFLKQQEKIVSELPSNIVSDIPKRLERLIMRLLEFEPAARFNRANEVIKEINKISGKKFEIETEKTIEGYLMSSQFVGREKEMEVLQSLYEKAQHGEGKFVLITGDAGIGKTRLLKEFSIFTQLRHSHSFIGYSYKDKIGPLEPFHDIFRELINYIDNKSEVRQSLAVLFKIYPDLTSGYLRRHLPKLVPLEPQAEKLRTLDALTELIKYCAKGLGELVILLEDLHWSDVLSVEFLEYLGRNLAESNVFICGTCRSEELGDNPTLMKMISGAKNEDYFTQLELKPLKFRSLYSFLDSTITPGSNSFKLVKYLMKKTSGNPFFVEEIMRTLLRKRRVNMGERVEIEHFERISIPETIEDIVLKRIEDLDSVSQEVVKFGVVLLKDFDYNLMRRLTGLKDTELSKALWELKRKQIIIEEDNRYRFYHATLRDVVSRRMGDKEKRDLNYQIGKTLEKISRGKLNTVIEDLAYYFINAKHKKKGIRYGLRAAEKSVNRYANEQAIKLYKGVLNLLGEKKSKLRFRILQYLAKIEQFTDSYDNAIKNYCKALKLKAGTIDKKIKIYLAIASVYNKKGEFEKALPIFQKSSKLLKKMKPGKLKTLLDANTKIKMYDAYVNIGDYKHASEFKFDYSKLPKDDLKDREAIRVLGSTYNYMGLIENTKRQYRKPDLDRSISFFKKAYKYYKKINYEVGIAAIMNNLANSYSAKFDFRNTLGSFQKAIQISTNIGDHYGIAIMYYNLGNFLNERGYYLKASDCFQRGISISKRIGNSFVTGGLFSGFSKCLFNLCDYKKAKIYCGMALEIFEKKGLKGYSVYPIYQIGNIYQMQGDYALALKFYRRALKISRDIRRQESIVYSFVQIGSVFKDIGTFMKAQKYISDALNLTTAVDSEDIKMKCYMHLCCINLILGNLIDAIDYQKKGIAIARKTGMKRELFQILLLLSRIYFNEKKYSKGINVANKALKLAKGMGTKDLYTEALLMKVKNGIKQGVISKVEVFKILEEAKKIAEEIGSPEILWRVYFEYGRYLQNNKEYLEALDYYQKCNGIFRDVISKIKNESYRKSYLQRPDRQAVDTAIKEIKSTLH